MEQCLGERKPCQGEINKSESFEAVHIVGHFREIVVFFQSCIELCHPCGFFSYDLSITWM